MAYKIMQKDENGVLREVVIRGETVRGSDFDSSDIDYIYYEKDGSKWINLNSNYYGEVTYKVSYKKFNGTEFQWLFIDAETMKKFAEVNGFTFQLLKEGSHYDYLGELRLT